MGKYNNFFNLIKKLKSIALIAHKDPDADAFASLVVMSDFLKQKLKIVTVDAFADFDLVDAKCKPFLPYIQINPDIKKYDAVILLDCTSFNRVGKYIDVINDTDTTINIDHHSTNKLEASLNIVEEISSTCELLYLMLMSKKYKLGKRQLAMLTAGILTDTNGLKVGRITPNTFKIVEEAVSFGVDIERLNENFFGKSTLKNMRLLSRTIQNIETYEKGKIIISTLSKNDLVEENATHEDTTGIMARIQGLEGSLFTCFIQERQDATYVSMRSSKGYDVSTVATKHGGGGHICAAAFLSHDSIDDIKILLVKELKKQLKNKVNNTEELF